MTKWREFYDSSFLKPEDLTEKGATVTIATVDPGEVEQDDGPEVKHQAVVTFKETKTKWGVNVINRHLIEALFGDEIEDAVGHRITLFQTPCEVAGKFKGQPSVRVKGSPELKKTLAVTIKLPKRKPFTRTLVPTGKPQTPPPSTGMGQNGDAGAGTAPATPSGVDVAETEDSAQYWPADVDEVSPDAAAAAGFLADVEKTNAAPLPRLAQGTARRHHDAADAGAECAVAQARRRGLVLGTEVAP